MATEFKRAEAELEEFRTSLHNLNASATIGSDQYNELIKSSENLSLAASNVRRKRLEVIEVENGGETKQVSKYYGPKMLERVIAFENGVAENLQLFEDWRKRVQVVRYNAHEVKAHPEEVVETFNPILKPSTIIQTSEELARQEQLRQQAENAVRALEASQALQIQLEANDPFIQEKKRLDALSVAKGLESFKIHYARIDIGRRKNLTSILEMIHRHPENEQFRSLSLNNKAVGDLLEGEGTKECLKSIGFVVRRMKINKESTDEEIVYFLHEPNVETDFDSWSAWFDLVKACYESSKSFK